MGNIVWPEKFPSEETMLGIIQKTITTSWKNGLTMEDVNKWLNNFTGLVFDCNDERKLALWMLLNFTYYNESEIAHLCRMVYKIFLHDIVSRDNLDTDEKISETIKKIYFAAIGNAGESGGLLLYYFRQEASISMDRFFYPVAIPDNSENILVFIDDVTLSGGTAQRFFYNNLQSMSYKVAYYITLFASEEAIKKITDLGVKVICCTHLDERDKCFSNKSIIFVEFPELQESAKFMAETYGEKLEPGKALGFKNGQYCFGFHYNTPNNTLPIFWSDNNWYPIFPRKEKIHNVKRRKTNFERYI